MVKCFTPIVNTNYLVKFECLDNSHMLNYHLVIKEVAGETPCRV